LILERYLARLMIGRLLVLLIGVTFMVLFLELLSTADEVVRGADDEAAALVRYMLLRAPLILSQLIPFIALLATLLVLTRLVRFSELVAIRGAGVSQFRVMLALAPVAVLIAIPQFALDNFVAPKMLTELRLWGVADYGWLNQDDDDGVWLRDGGSILQIGSFDAESERLINVRVFERREDGQLERMIEAQEAVYEEDHWTLRGVRISDPRERAPEEYKSAVWQTNVTPDVFQVFSQHPQELPLRQLLHFVFNPSYGNQPQYLYEVWFHKRLALPIATIVIVLICVPLVQRFERSTGPAIMIFSGIAIGFFYLAFDDLVLSVGEAGLMPAVVAAWIPTLAIAAIGGTIAFHFELHR
jgi:lipopolysaccharide export system permease protein